MVRQIVIELETPGDSRTMFRLRIDASLIADDLTAAQAHVLAGEILDRIILPKEASPTTEPAAEIAPAPSVGRWRLRAIVDMPRRSWAFWRKAGKVCRRPRLVRRVSEMVQRRSRPLTQLVLA